MEPYTTILFPNEHLQGRYAIGNRKMLEILSNQYERLDTIDTIKIGKDIVYGWRLEWTREDGTTVSEYIYCRTYELDEGIQISESIIDSDTDLITDVRVFIHGFRRITHLVADADSHLARDIEGLDTLLQDYIQMCQPIIAPGTRLSVFDKKSGRLVHFLIKNVFITTGKETRIGFAMDSEYSVDIRVPGQPVLKEPEPVLKEPEPVLKEPEPVLKEPEPVLKEPEPVLKEPEPVLTPQQLREARLRYFDKLYGKS